MNSNYQKPTKLPNFFVIGAAKSGTTALYRYLRQHPEIFMSDRKEPHHFSYTEESKKTNGPSDYIRSAITDFQQYLDLFERVSHEIAIGEASPTYIYVPGTAERIHSIFPNARIIAILRNPADRAYSAFMHLIRDGRETVSTFREALALEGERIAANWGPIYHYTKSGFYYEQLTRYYQIFPTMNIKVILYDDFVNDPFQLMKDLYTFLDVDNGFIPDMSSKPNVSGKPKYKIWQKIMDWFFAKPNPIRAISRILFPEPFRWQVTSYLRNKNLERENLPDEYRKMLVPIFEKDIICLEKLIHRDLSIWLKD